MKNTPRVECHQMELAETVLGSKEAALRWLNRPAPAFDGKIPFELLKTQVGSKAVENVLLAIEHGVYL